MDTVRIKVHVDAKKETLKKISDDTYEVWIKEPAQRNMANRRLMELVAEIRSVNLKSVRILKGARGITKTFVINDNEI